MCLFLDIEFLEEEKKGAIHRSSQWTGAVQMRSGRVHVAIPVVCLCSWGRQKGWEDREKKRESERERERERERREKTE